MACVRKRENWAFENLEKVVGEVQKGLLLIREATAKYTVPKSTLFMIMPAWLSSRVHVWDQHLD